MNKNWSDKSVLIVEDTKVNCMLFKAILEHTNIKITFANSSDEFYKFYRRNKKYDLILMDINLGEKTNGIDLIRYLQSIGNKVPIIIQSAYGNQFYICDDIKYYAIIAKPINISLLYDLMESALTLNKH